MRLGLPLVIVFALLALVGPWLAPHDPQAIDLAHAFEPPSATHWLGTGDNGVDLLSVLLHGARLAGVVGLLVVAFTATVGTLIGALAGFSGGRVDAALSSLADLLQAFPGLVLNVAILALVDAPGVRHVVLALCIPGWVLYARIARAEALRLRQAEFVQAAVALGATRARVLVRHVIPNLLGPIVVQATTAFGGVVLAESTLSFLGLGPSDGVSWGALLDQGSAVLLRFPHVALVSGAAIALTVLGFNLAGDAARDRWG
jgi:peptide/nickel transport system permease protein